MTLLRIAIRSHRIGFLALAWIGAMAGMLNAVAYAQLAGTTPAERQLFAQQMELLGRQLTYLLPPPVQLDTMGGYLTWRAFGSIGLIFALWGALAGAGAARGDEEKGLTEAWLASGVSRVRWLVTRTIGFTVAATGAVAVAVAATELGTAISNDAVDGLAMAEIGVVMLALTVVGFGVGMAVAQLILTRRVAATAAAGVVIGLFELNSVTRAGGEAGAARYLSPFYYADQSTPLLRDGGLDVAATATLFVIAFALVALAIAAFARRDVGGSVLRVRVERTNPTFRPARDPLLRIPVLAAIRQDRWEIVGWSAGLALLGWFLTSLTRTMIDAVAQIPTLRIYLVRLGATAYSDFVGVIWFSTALLILSALVIAQVNSWAADDAEGRLDMVLAAGASRARVVIERIAAILIFVLIVAAVSSTVVAIAAQAMDITVPNERMALATILVVPVAFAIAGLGHLLVGWRPRVAVVLLGAITIVSYFTQQFGPVFDWPDWVTNTSFFKLYGTPMTSDDRSGIVILTAIGVFGTAAALLAMRRRDVGA